MKRVQIDVELIHGEAAIGLIRGVAIAQRRQGENLPKGESRLGKQIHEMVGLLSEIADAKAARQRIYADENTGLAFVFHMLNPFLEYLIPLQSKRVRPDRSNRR